jgi:CDP-glucose 4,6-dehydratase
MKGGDRIGFWRGRRVFITGHTGFKGSWLCLWLSRLGAEVTGYALDPPTRPSLFKLCSIHTLVHSIRADVRDAAALKRCLRRARPEVVIHMAAQPLVRESYAHPLETFAVNVMGTVHLLEAARSAPSVRAVVNVTTDKVYEDLRVSGGYRENEPLGGHDPYSGSKACADLVAHSYRRSFGMPVANARAGNVIGGGDWAADRVVPDFIRAILKGRTIRLRCPEAVRPWQHVLEPLSGYLHLAQSLYQDGAGFAEAWNFGPDKRDAKTVGWLVHRLCRRWGEGARYEIDPTLHPREAGFLMLDNAKAKKRLHWRPKWRIERTIDRVIEWTQAWRRGDDVRKVCLEQIEEHMAG